MSSLRAFSIAMPVLVVATLAACAAPSSEESVAGDPQALTACDASGTWAIKVSTPVKWPASFVLQAGAGTVTNWIKSTRTQTGTSIVDDAEICGIDVPDYQAAALFGSEKYGVKFPDATFGTLPKFPLAGTLSSTEVGATYTSGATAALLGATMANPTTDAWPASGAALGPQDADNDTKPGLSGDAKSGGGLSNPPVNAIRSVRANRVYTTFRHVLASTQGVVKSCDRVEGTGTIAVINNKPAIDSHVLGCRREDGTDCNSSEFKLLDSAAPVYSPTGDAVITMVKLPAGAPATCADVRALTF